MWPPDTPTRKCPVYSVYPRPGLKAFLEQAAMLPNMTINVWTAGRRSYAESIFQALALRSRFTHVWGYEDCVVDPDAKPTYRKDLAKRILAGLSSEQLMFVEDKPEVVISHGATVVAIAPFTGSPEDDALTVLSGVVSSWAKGERISKAALIGLNAQPQGDWWRKRGWRWVYDWAGEQIQPASGGHIGVRR